MLDVDRLPDFVFVDEDGAETRLALRDCAPRIRAIGDHLAGSLPRGAVVGLMFRSGPELVLAWLGSLAAGLRPLVMQYPTRKQSRAYWADSVRNTVASTGLAAVVADAPCCALGLAELVATIPQAALEALPDGPPGPLVLQDFAIVQLSSGTTGHRKAVEFTAAALARHVADYNAVLGLTASDRIVSWLPLYHDMGYVACFVMPLLLGIPVVMMDPMDWVRRPDLLSEAIARHGGTVCYQPNFGFEVMGRAAARELPSMRWWISCSEPVSADTARRFLAHFGVAEQNFAPCYAMAENIFALSLRRGIATREIDGVEVVSCGTPIPGVALKLVEGQIWARSPTSLAGYMGGEDIRDGDGFYPTGDLGEIVDGEVFVTGRRQDLLIQAGRKFMLSDIDLTLNRLYPDIRGRAAALAMDDARLGTQLPLVLIEAAEFFRRTDQDEIAEALKSALGIDQIDVAFVPPRFLTKTSSGKINRKASAANWRLHLAAMRQARVVREDPVAELRESFAGADWDKPVGTGLDSLSLTVLRVILGGTALGFDGEMSLAQIAAALAVPTDAPAAAPASGSSAAVAEEVIRIVSIADGRMLERVSEADLDALGVRLGARVTLEHVCLPPSAVLLSDLIFHDWFQPRLDQADFAAVNRAFARLRGASMIIADDIAEMFYPPNQVYGALSHNLERDPRADLIAVRWQRYAQHHDRLPLTVAAGANIPLEESSRSLAALSDYLRVPVFRIASIRGFAAFTEGWEYRPLNAAGAGKYLVAADPGELVAGIAGWAAALPAPLCRRPPPAGPRLDRADLPHYCSHYSSSAAIDVALAKFASFCLVGQDSSVPYIRKALDRLGKPHVQVPSYAPEALAGLDFDAECLLICGAQGNFPITRPAIAIMQASNKWTVCNIDDPELKGLIYSQPKSRPPESGEDWYHRFALDRATPREAIRGLAVDGALDDAVAALRQARETLRIQRRQKLRVQRRQERIEQRRRERIEQRRRERMLAAQAPKE